MRVIDTDFGDDVNPQDIAAWERDLRRLQGLYDDALDRAGDAHRLQAGLLQKQSQCQAELNQVNSQIPGAQTAADSARSQVADLASRLEEFRTARDAATAGLLGMMQTLHPLLLFPIRLETRFVSPPNDGSGVNLLLRIFPDDIHNDTHEPGLTEEEERWGRQFWTNTTAAADDIEKKKLAWRQLADRFGIQRAAWIARVLDPANPGTVTRRDGSWTRAPQTEVLADRWVAVGYRSGRPVFTAWGNPIPDLLATGLSPLADSATVGDGLPPVDDGMRWMIDFEAAVAVGMGLRISLTNDQAQGGFERLLVVGIKSTLNAGDSASRLAGLLDAQHYTHELALVEQDTPTNNTTESSSGYSSSDLEGDRNFEVERGDPLVQAGDRSDGEAVASALGIDLSVFAHLRGSNQEEQRASQAMSAALWPVLDTPFLSQLSAQVSAEFIRDHWNDSVRARGPLPSFRVGNQPYGLLPATSLNRWKSLQETGDDSALAKGLSALRQTWRLYARSAPCVGLGNDIQTLLRQEANSCSYLMTRLANGSLSAEDPLLIKRSSIAWDDPAVNLPPSPNYLSLLRQSSFETIRDESYPDWDVKNAPKPHPLLYLILRQAALKLMNPPAPELEAFLQSLAQLETQTVAALQLLMAETMDASTYRWDAWVTSLATKRMKMLRGNTPSGLRFGGYGWLENVRPGPGLRQLPVPPGDTGGPLYASDGNKGFVQAPSLAQAAAAAVLRSGYLSHKQDAQGDPLAVDLSSDRVQRSQWLLDGVRQGQSLGALLGYRFERGLHDKGLDVYVYPFRALAGLKSQDELAKAYDDLKKAEDLAKVVGDLYAQSNEAAARANEDRLLLQQLENQRQQYQGELDAINQLEQLAAAADSSVAQLDSSIASLRAAKPQSRVSQQPGRPNFNVDILDERDLDGWTDQLVQLQGQRQTAAGEAAMAHSKFNERVGVRDFDQTKINILNNPNNPVGILAIQAEIAQEDATASALDQEALSKEGTRGKAEADLAAARAALGQLLNEQWQKALESLAANNVVDGLELQRRWKTGTRRQPPEQPWDATTIPFGNDSLGFPAPGSDDFASLDTQLQALDEMVDAVSDVVLAESVYHLVQGNPLRSGATLDAIAAGEMAPPELEVVRTPRTGIGLTHRLLVLGSTSSGVDDASSLWATSADQVRAPAEPFLNAWVAKLIGDPSRIHCRAEYFDQGTGQVLGDTEVALSQLLLSPLDVVFMAEGNEEAQRSELEQRLVFHLLKTRPESMPEETDVRLDFARDPVWTPAIVSFGELIEVAQTIRKLIAGSRAIDGRDLSLPEDPAPPGIDVQELTDRADRAVQAFQQAQQALQVLLPATSDSAPGTTPDLDQLRTALFGIASFGIQGATPLSATGDTPEKQNGLLVQASSVSKEVSRRLDTIARLEITDTASLEEERNYHLARIREVFGPDFRILPRLTPVNNTVLSQAFGDSATVQGNDPFAALTWFQRLARIRDGVSRLDAALMYAGALTDDTGLTLQVGQLPYTPQDRWVALPPVPGQQILGGRLSLVAHMPMKPALPFPFGEPLVGLLIDEWVEVVPSNVETTGLAFHYDQPNSCPPQAVLIAVPSDETREVWDLDFLDSVLQETFDLAQMRAISFNGLGEAVWVEDSLPAGATPLGDGESWNWVSTNPVPFFGGLAHQSILAAGMHQHFFLGATDKLQVGAGEILYSYVYLDPANVPSEVMLQWNDVSWEHRAYWGTNSIQWGIDGTASRRYMGPVPPAGQWVRLEVPADQVGLEGKTLVGMAFTLSDGRATWDRAGKAYRPTLTFDVETTDFSRAVGVSAGG
ncbi:MAG TPA: hypothetical protein VMW38_07095 [Terriglobia bacterium]|nr:hypothetical protein [Terriglobia bacterium]